MARTERLRVYPDAVAYSFASQAEQYPPLGAPGVQFYPGVQEGFDVPINCLLWRDEDGRIRGILNHYPIAYPPYERAGNVNVFVQEEWRRQGIATRLIKEAQRMWGPLNIAQQRYTQSGAEMIVGLLTKEDVIEKAEWEKPKEGER